MEKLISIVIPNYNRRDTIGKCLAAAFSSKYGRFEVIVVDDCSTDDSVDVIRQFPCKLIQLDKQSGASQARNTGADHASGEIIFFIDSDCLLQADTLTLVNKAMLKYNDDRVVVGGTYTRIPPNDRFFCTFQSVFVNYFELKRQKPDYIATHAMAISSRRFKDVGGFLARTDFLPIMEDVEYSHRLRRAGCELVMHPEILVGHIFNFTLRKSLRNAWVKTLYWIVYGMQSRNVLADSGTASTELKINGAAFLLTVFGAILALISGNPAFGGFVALVIIVNLLINRRLLASFYAAKGPSFAIAATFYYTLLYPAAVWAGTVAGIVKYLWKYRSSAKEA